jgi:hypothetical protein
MNGTGKMSGRPLKDQIHSMGIEEEVQGKAQIIYF